MKTIEEKIVVLFSDGLSCSEISKFLNVPLSKVEEVIDEVEIQHFDKYGSLIGGYG